jgi:hypothetical protein
MHPCLANLQHRTYVFCPSRYTFQSNNNNYDDYRVRLLVLNCDLRADIDRDTKVEVSNTAQYTKFLRYNEEEQQRILAILVDRGMNLLCSTVKCHGKHTIVLTCPFN